MFKATATILCAILLAGPAAADFKTPGGPYGTWLRQIGLGRFEIARGATRNESEVIAFQTRRLRLLGAIYHDVFDGMCEITGPSRSFSQRIDTVTTNFTGREVDRQEGATESIKVRAEYVDIFNGGYALASNPAELVLTMGPNVGGVLLELAKASRDVIRSNGCGSEGLDVFERNLAAIIRGKPSLQERGELPGLLEQECSKSGLAGMATRSATPVAKACSCLARSLRRSLPEDMYAQIEERFSREQLLLSAALTPKAWKDVQSCVQ